MGTRTEPKVVQVWSCPKCGSIYNSPLKVSKVTCSSKHNRIIMKLVEGPEGKRGAPRPVPVRTVVVKQDDWVEPPLRPKASLVVDPGVLLKALGISD